MNIHRNFLTGIIYLCLLLCMFRYDACQLHAQKNEAAIKAAFIYNFCKYTVWKDAVPNEEENEFRIGIIGDESISTILRQTVENKTIKNDTIKVVNLNPADENHKCKVIFISEKVEKRLIGTFLEKESKNTLTISDLKEFAKNGGMVELYPFKNQMAYDFNITALKDAKLSVHPQIIKIANNVIE